MKTRVIKYWYKTEWLYKVEEYLQATGDEKWVVVGGGEPTEPEPKKGEWYWAYVAAPLSFKKAHEVAQARSEGKPYEKFEVVTEFEDGRSAS